jgi:hypothetical protein
VCLGGCAKTTIGQKGFRRTHQSNGPPLPSSPLSVDAIQAPGCSGVTHAIQSPGCPGVTHAIQCPGVTHAIQSHGCPGCRCPCYDGEGKRGGHYLLFAL